MDLDFNKLIDSSITDVWHSARLFLPEIVLCVTMLVVLLARIPRLGQKVDSALLALVGCGAALGCQAVIGFGHGGEPSWIFNHWQAWVVDAFGTQRPEIFTGLLVFDAVTAYFRTFLIGFAALLIILCKITGVPDRDAAPDIFTLILGAVLGMCLMVSANHLLIVFLGIEIASVPSYVLAGMIKGRRRASEAALKFSIYGAGAAGVMLYGISLIAGTLGSAHLPTLAQILARDLPHIVQNSPGELTVLVLGGLMITVGLAFKLSAVPFHFWTPDVFEGATAEINAFLSVASKGAALALLVRVAMGFGSLPAENLPIALAEPAGAMAVADHPSPPAGANTPQVDEPIAVDGLTWVRNYIALIVGVLAAVTCTFGNLAAYGQTNIKRLLAYSTIAHAGYMMMPVAAALNLLNQGENALAAKAIAALAFYVVIYLFMNLGAFAIVAFLRNQIRSERIEDYAGLVRYCPGVVICLAILLFSLVGLPPLAGFIGKFFIFAALVEAGMLWLVVIAGLNTAVSLFYYLRVVKVMTIDAEPEDRLPVGFSPVSSETLYTLAVTLPVVVFGILFNGLWILAQDTARSLM